MKAPKFAYVRAESVEHACKLLAEHGDEARVLAGGQSLMPTLNMRLSHPRVLIDINPLEQLVGSAYNGKEVRIGALTRHADIMLSHLIAKFLPLVALAIPHVAHVAVRNRGTFGGSIALADPAAEMPACLLALGGRIVLQSVRGRREVPADAFFHGLYQTAREPDELLIEAIIPPQPIDERCAFQELSRRHGDFAIAGVAARAKPRGAALGDVRLVYFGSEVKPTLAMNAMAAVEGKSWGEDIARAAGDALARDLDPMDNLYGEPAVKLQWQRVLTKRALDAIASEAKAA